VTEETIKREFSEEEILEAIVPFLPLHILEGSEHLHIFKGEYGWAACKGLEKLLGPLWAKKAQLTIKRMKSR